MSTGKGLQISRMEDEYQELECTICIERYSDHRIPRNLVCGHSVCNSCLQQLSRRSKRCPECRTDFSETMPSDLSINHPLLRVSRIITYATTDPNVYPEVHFPLKYPSSDLAQNAGICDVHGATMFFMCISCSVWVCRICVEVQHPDPPHGKCYIMSAEDAIQKMKCIHTKNLQSCIGEVYRMQYILDIDINNLAVASKCLKFQDNSCDSECSTDILSFENHCNMCKATVVTLDSMRDALVSARDKILASNTPQEINESIKLSNESQASFENIFEIEKKRELPDLSLEKLLRGKGLKDLLKEGNPVFVERYTDTVSWTKIALENDKLHLYSLTNDSPPENCITLPYDSVRVLVPKEAPVLFMEVGWGSEVRGVVYVRMYGDTARGRNAVFLCSGERGKSYKGAKFFRVTREGDTAHQLHGGDFGYTIPVVDDITYSPDYVHELKAGLFFGHERIHDEHCLALFSVCLTDAQPGQKISSGFGAVEEGLDILKEVPLLASVRDACVMDCGLIIPV